MAETRLSDVIVPEVFTPNVIERTSEITRFIQSGIATTDNIPIGTGETINLPFYQDLSGEDAVWNDTDDITLNPISMARDTAVVLTREKAWGSTDLARALGQDDPMTAIRDLVAGYWSRRFNATLIATLSGAMAAANMTDNVFDISALEGAASDFDGMSFVDATAMLGDRQHDLTAIAVHPVTYASMRKQDLIDFVPISQGPERIPTYQGAEVIFDRNMPVDDGVYTSYLFGPGAVSFVEEVVPNANEPARLPLTSGGTDALITRRKFIMHPRGIRWIGSAASATPDNDELGTAGNWTRVWENQNIKIVQFCHTVS